MGYLKKRVAYLKDIAEGMRLDGSLDQVKFVNSIIDVLDDFASAVENIEKAHKLLSEQVEGIDENLAEVEEAIFEKPYESVDVIECPFCNEKIDLDDDTIDDGYNTIECPNCGREIEFKWEGDCEECDEQKNN